MIVLPYTNFFGKLISTKISGDVIMTEDKFFSKPMIFLYCIALILWSYLLTYLEVNIYFIILNPINFALFFNIVYGIMHQKKIKSASSL